MTFFSFCFAGLGEAGGLGGSTFAPAFAGGRVAVATTPFPFFLPVSGAAAAGRTATAAALAARPLFAGGGGGGGGGGGASGLKNLNISVRERSYPSSKSIITSCAIFGYSGNSDVMRRSVLSGDGIFCCDCRHLVKKFLIFCTTAC